MKFELTFIIGLIFLVVPIVFFIPETLEELEIFKIGKEVRVEIAEMPRNCNAKRKFAKFKYSNVFFVKQVSRDFCQLYKRGDSLAFLHSPKSSEVFVFPGSPDYYYIQMISAAALSLLGLFIIFQSRKISSRLSSFPFLQILIKRTWW